MRLLALALFITQVYSFEFAHIAKEIVKHKTRSHFAQKLYDEVAKATDNFTTNLTFLDLKKMHVDPVYLDFMACKHVETNPNIYVSVVWPAVIGHDKLIHDLFNKYSNIVCYKNVLMSKQAARNFLNHIPCKASHRTGMSLWFPLPNRDFNPMRCFVIECKPNHENLNTIKDYLTNIFSNNRNFINQFERTHGTRALQNLHTTTVCKREIRKAVNIDHAMHICDTAEESLDLAKLLFNENSINCLKHSNPTKVAKLNNFKTFVPLLKNRLGKYLDQIVVYNSAVLSAYGLRDCADLDFLHDPRIQLPNPQHRDLSIQNQFFPRKYVILEDKNRKTYILEDCPNAFLDKNLDTCTNFRQKISIDDLLYNPRNYFHFHGVKYATLEFMHYFKKSRGRPKDRRDVELIEAHYRATR